MAKKFDVRTFDLPYYRRIVKRGLSRGKGHATGQVCVEVAISMALNEGFSDDPSCVEEDTRCEKIELNDSEWSSSSARARGMERLGVAQLGSAGTFKPMAFLSLFYVNTVRTLLPNAFERGVKLHPMAKSQTHFKSVQKLVRRCGKVKTCRQAATLLGRLLDYRSCTYGTLFRFLSIVGSIPEVDAASITFVQAYRQSRRVFLNTGQHSDYYLLLCADVMLKTLRQLKSPGVRLLKKLK